jgi:hypothetical protein
MAPVSAASAASTRSMPGNDDPSTPLAASTARRNVSFGSSADRNRPLSSTAVASGNTSAAVPATAAPRKSGCVPATAS